MADPAEGGGGREARGSAAPVVVNRFDPQTIAILLDVDGTLIEIAPTPQEVRVPPVLKHTLSRLRDRLSGALCLISGRPLSDLDRLFDPLRLPCVGGHGAENRLDIHGDIVRSATPPLDPILKRRLIGIADDTPGIIAEEKAYSVALHYRLVPESERSVRERIARICADWPADEIEILPGKSVFEIKPRGFNKGVAVVELMQRAPFRERRPIFVGDDVTDESVFAVLPKFGGLGFSVGRELPGAHGYFATPREVRHWLYDLMQGRDTLPRPGFARGRGIL
ncbi:MAG TPA: trehalose-phosphatase [Xanthobacteraceae bacterium]|nr:trehalose-phosphatase [Xanthobacteraceae bacterium]